MLSFNGYSRGLGAATTMTVRRIDGTTMTFAAPGLGYDQNGDGEIATWEPMRPLRPHGALNLSGTVLQSVAFDFAIVRGLRAGVDVDGDGATDLDAARIYRFGQSQGAMEGLIAFTLEPAIRAAVFNVPSGTANYNTLGQPIARGLFGSFLGARVPSVVNSAYGITSIDGVAVAPPHGNENLPLRDEPVRVNTVPGAVAIQQDLDRTVWAAQASNVVAFAPMLRRAPPPGVPARPFIFQMARSDQNATNPSQVELVRAAAAVDRVAWYRHDLHFGTPDVPANPHSFLTAVGRQMPNYRQVGVGAQNQIGVFFESDGRRVIHPSPAGLWEVPTKTPLPGDLFYLPRRQ